MLVVGRWLELLLVGEIVEYLMASVDLRAGQWVWSGKMWCVVMCYVCRGGLYLLKPVASVEAVTFIEIDHNSRGSMVFEAIL